MESDRTQGCESGFFKRSLHPGSASGNLCHQQPGHTRDFRVYSKSCAGAGDAVARLQIGDSLAGRNHGSRAAVSGSLWLIETAAHGLHCRQNTVALNLADDLPDQIRTGPRLLHEILAGKLGGRTFCACGNYRCRNPHQHTAGQKLRHRNFRHGDFSGPRVLENLFHDLFLVIRLMRSCSIAGYLCWLQLAGLELRGSAIKKHLHPGFERQELPQLH